MSRVSIHLESASGEPEEMPELPSVVAELETRQEKAGERSKGSMKRIRFAEIIPGMRTKKLDRLASAITKMYYKTARPVGTFWAWPTRTWFQERLKKLARK